MIESLSGAAGKVGLAPGLLVHIGDLPECEIRISVIDDDRDSLKQQVVKSIDEMQSRQGKDAVNRVHIVVQAISPDEVEAVNYERTSILLLENLALTFRERLDALFESARLRPLMLLMDVYGMNFRYMPAQHWRWACPML